MYQTFSRERQNNALLDTAVFMPPLLAFESFDPITVNAAPLNIRSHKYFVAEIWMQQMLFIVENAW